jgi:predicted hotdog family 3-hydroxylacyl-ACP dehydratase
MKIPGDILSFIPQRHPFVMVDNLLFADNKTAATDFIIRDNNIFFEEGEFSEAGLLENIAQTAAAGAGYRAITGNKSVSPGYIGAVKNFEVFKLPGINDILTTEVSIANTIFNMINVEGKIMCNGSLIAQCEMRIFIQHDH